MFSHVLTDCIVCLRIVVCFWFGGLDSGRSWVPKADELISSSLLLKGTSTRISERWLAALCCNMLPNPAECCRTSGSSTTDPRRERAAPTKCQCPTKSRNIGKNHHKFAWPTTPAIAPKKMGKPYIYIYNIHTVIYFFHCVSCPIQSTNAIKRWNLGTILPVHALPNSQRVFFLSVNRRRRIHPKPKKGLVTLTATGMRTKQNDVFSGRNSFSLKIWLDINAVSNGPNKQTKAL